MYDIISASINLRYLLELAANGMRDGRRASLGKMERLNLLVKHEIAWRALSWSDNTSIHMLSGWGEPVSVSGNIIAFRNAPNAASEELLVLRAPSKLRNVQMKHWVIQLPHDTQDVCISSAQDLLVYRCGYVVGAPSSFNIVMLTTSGSPAPNRFTSAPFLPEKLILSCDILALSTLPTAGDTALEVCVSMETTLP